MSEQITFWDSSGSRVSRGNLLVLPIEDSLLYVQPLFLQADQTSIPELKKVVVVFGDTIVMRDTLAEALSALFGAGVDVDTPGEPTQPETGGNGGQPPPSSTLDPRVADLMRRALVRFADAEKALREGRLGEYQEATDDAEALLRQAQALVEPGSSGSTSPTPSPTATATPSPMATPEPQPSE